MSEGKQYADMTVEELIDEALRYSSRISETDAVIELSKRAIHAVALRDEVARLTKALLFVDFTLAQPGDDETPANLYVPSRAEIESCTRVLQAALTPQGGKGGV